MVKFSPDVQVVLAERMDDEWITGEYPTLGALTAAYGTTAAVQWLIAQLFNLSEYCGCREKFTRAQILECARVIASRYYYLKVTEFLKFFYEMKAGTYGKFYGALDPMVVTTSLREFVAYRNNRLDAIESEKRVRELAEHRKHAVSRAEYERMVASGAFQTTK